MSNSTENFSNDFLDFAQNPEKWLSNLTLCNLQQGPFGFILKKRCSLFFSAFKDALLASSMGDFDLPQKIKSSYAKIDPAGALDPKTMFILNIYSTQLQWLFFSQNTSTAQNDIIAINDINSAHGSTQKMENKTQNLVQAINDEYTVSFKNENNGVKCAPIVKTQHKTARCFAPPTKYLK